MVPVAPSSDADDDAAGLVAGFFFTTIVPVSPPPESDEPSPAIGDATVGDAAALPTLPEIPAVPELTTTAALISSPCIVALIIVRVFWFATSHASMSERIQASRTAAVSAAQM
eukprot:Amastigsp_a4211_4.p3 type:complete len:113 gc:universal Amastigsp_a4211_4:653-315(-)